MFRGRSRQFKSEGLSKEGKGGLRAAANRSLPVYEFVSPKVVNFYGLRAADKT